MWIITHIDPTRTVCAHTSTRAQLEGEGYGQFIYTGSSPHCPPDTHSHTHMHTHTDIGKEWEWDVSVYLCESGGVINQACVSASNQSRLLTVTRRTLTLAIQHTHAWFPSDCQANFMQTFEMSYEIRCKLSDFPSSGMKMNISGKSWDSFRNWLALGKLLLSFGVS